MEFSESSGQPETVQDGWVLRHAGMEDIDALLRLWHVADAAPTRTDNPASMRQLIAHDPNALIVAERDGQLVGAIIAAWDGWRGSIYRLAVTPEIRRHGLARQLLDAAERRLAAAGGARIQAIVVGNDAQALAFWNDAPGWERQPNRVRFVRG